MAETVTSNGPAAGVGTPAAGAGTPATGVGTPATGTGTRERVEAVLEMIRPYVQADGGDIELVDIVEDIVQIRLAGACVGCMYSMMTLQAGIERMLKEQVPEIKAVEAIPF